MIDPFIGTGGWGFGAGSHNPSAQYPHGNLRLGPDTAKHTLLGPVALPFNHYGGYHHGDDVITGFSHTHLVGAGVGDYGNFGVLPTRSPLSDAEAIEAGRPRSTLPLNHSTELAGPGWYAVNVSGTPSIQIMLAASGSHAGVHSYAFASRSAAKATAGMCALVIDACHAAEVVNSKCKNASIAVEPLDSGGGVRVRASVDFAGQLTRRSPAGSVAIHFYAEVEQQTSAASSSQSASTSAAAAASSVSLLRLLRSKGVAIVHVPCVGGSRVRAAISFLSPSQAETNLRVQAPRGITVDSARSSAELAWKQLLSTSGVRIVDAAGASPATLRAFHTAVYRAHLAPTIWDEPASGGEKAYLSMDGTPRVLGAATQDLRRHAYTDLSLWDIHRTQLPWLSLTAPTIFADVVRSLEAMGVEGGDVPRWPLANVYTGCMIGNHAIAVVAEAIAKGQTARALGNATRLYELFRASATQTRPHAGRSAVEAWVTHGYVPAEDSEHSASLTLSYAFDDASLAILARHVGRAADAATFEARSASGVRAGWSASRELMCPRNATSGKLQCPIAPFIPYPGSPHYVEGDALQWLWFVPQDPASLVRLFSTPGRFVRRLDEFLQPARRVHSTVLANPWYWAGNEPDLLAPWLYAFVPGAQHKTASATRWLAQHRYTDQADGLPGNDDFGTMSAWLIWAQLGLYPLAGSDRFVLGSPRFAEAVVGLGGSGDGGGSGRAARELRIVAHNASDSCMYVRKAQLNGQAIDMVAAPFVRFADLITPSGDGTSALLEFWMAETPV